MTVTEPKPRGRPRKTPLPQNPDEAVATRGYVKCVARKVVANSIHSHTDYNNYPFVLGIISVIVFAVCVLSQRIDAAIVLGVIVLSVAVDAVVSYNHTSLEIPNVPKTIQEYEPPEPKKEC